MNIILGFILTGVWGVITRDTDNKKPEVWDTTAREGTLLRDFDRIALTGDKLIARGDEIPSQERSKLKRRKLRTRVTFFAQMLAGRCQDVVFAKPSKY